jgi:hypothetical protein
MQASRKQCQHTIKARACMRPHWRTLTVKKDRVGIFARSGTGKAAFSTPEPPPGRCNKVDIAPAGAVPMPYFIGKTCICERPRYI